MLRVTVELWSGGRPESARVIAFATISNISSGAYSDYMVRLEADDEAPREAVLRRYPRWSASLWDLVARCVLLGYAQKERMPRRPSLARVEEGKSSNGMPIVRLDDVPEPARSVFRERLSRYNEVLFVDGVAYGPANRWHRFLEGRG